MLTIAIMLGLRPKPSNEPCLAQERAVKRAKLERLIDEIAETRRRS